MKADSPMGKAFDFKGGAHKEHGCLLIHGFTGTPGQMRALGERLRDEGYTVKAPLLPGHGTTLEDMSKSNWHEWLAAARTAYSSLREQCATVTVMGLSMGGALATILAEEYPVDSLVCLSAALLIKDRLSVLAPIAGLIKPYMEWAPPPNKTKPGFEFLDEYDAGYSGMPLNKVYDLRKLARTARSALYAVVAPTLVIQPINDESVNPESANVIIKGVSSERKKLVWLEKSGHVCTLGPEHEAVFAETLDFIKD